MLFDIDKLERERVGLQSQLDSTKTQTERNRLGQFSTPTALAQDILNYAAGHMSGVEKIRFLDPAIGTGAFYSALIKAFSNNRVVEALGFEIDSHYGKPAEKFWRGHNLKFEHADFTSAESMSRFNLIICNPPYVRHHHINTNDKNRLKLITQQASGMKLSGLASLYCHFLGISHGWLSEDGLSGWLIPSEFMDVNYGQAVKQYLLNRVTLQHIHRFDPNDVQFDDALVSSAIVWFKKTLPPTNHEVKFTFGGTLSDPKDIRYIQTRVLASESKWTRFPVSDVRIHSDFPKLSDYFQIKRGLVTGDNKYFILSEEEITARGLPMEVFTPILPSPRHLKQDEIKARSDGTPDIERRLFLLDTRLSEAEIFQRYPTLTAYLDEGMAQRLHERYICRHRFPWYLQEDRPPAPIICTYLGRGDSKNDRPFRFIYNNSLAKVSNVYLVMYPKSFLANELEGNPDLIRKIWVALNEIPSKVLLGEGRVYGGGLHKLEPRELGNVPAIFVRDLLPLDNYRKKFSQMNFFAEE